MAATSETLPRDAGVVDEQLSIDIPPAARRPKTQLITRTQIHPDPEQPRKHADAELRNSLARNGMLQPITVRPHPEILGEWMIVDGERRWRSAEGVLEDLVCLIRSDQDELARRLATQLEANTGKPLAPLEEAHAFQRIAVTTGMSPAEIAEFTGRPKSTVAERLALLDLGPWVPLLESGEIVLSHAVKVLVPLRGAADAAHEHAIDYLRKDYRYQHKGGGPGISLGDFERLMDQAYRPSMYPLTKTKTRYHKQPEFNTSAHDAECDCGGVLFEIDHSGSKRRCCANPGWWRPRHRKALAAKKPKAEEDGRARDTRKQLYLPTGTKTVKASYGSAPDGVTLLTDAEGAWAVRTHDARPFDPADLEIDDGKLVTWQSYPGSYPHVGTRDANAVRRAREKWTARWDAERTKLLEKFGEQLRARLEEFRVEGTGLVELARLFDREAGRMVLDVAEALGWQLPDNLTKGDGWSRYDRAAAWVATVTPDSASTLLSGMATAIGLKLKLPSERLAQLQQAAIENIRKRAIPWKAKPKDAPKAKSSTPGKKGKKAKRADRHVPLGKLSTETAELFDDEGEDELGAGWEEPRGDEDDLWDTDDESEELEEVES